jgi:hypothetical protein
MLKVKAYRFYLRDAGPLSALGLCLISLALIPIAAEPLALVFRNEYIPEFRDLEFLAPAIFILIAGFGCLFNRTKT